MKCEMCHKKLYQGQDVFQVRQGVLGPRGFIPLEDQFFCLEQCMRKYYDDPSDTDEREGNVNF